MAAAKKPEMPMFDATKFFGEYDPSKFMGEFQKAMGEFKVPNVDMTAVVESQRKNIEAVAAANKVALEGMQAVFTRQGEIMKQAMEEMQGVFTDLKSIDTPQASVAKQTELVKTAVEKALSNMKELAEMAGKSNGEAFTTIHKRFNESLDEVKDQVAKLQK